MRGLNIAVSGLTAAGKTTHSRLLSAELGYRYVSATAIIADMIGIPRSEVDSRFWQRHGEKIARLRDTTDLDRELDTRLLAEAASEEGLVIDAWALPWLAPPDNCLFVWIESDHWSRTLKAAVSDECRNTLEWYSEFIKRKDDDTQARFLSIYGFDLYGARQHFDVDIDNSSFITEATRADSDRGISGFQPELRRAVEQKLRQK